MGAEWAAGVSAGRRHRNDPAAAVEPEAARRAVSVFAPHGWLQHAIPAFGLRVATDRIRTPD
jgi:hypothetical protein